MRIQVQAESWLGRQLVRMLQWPDWLLSLVTFPLLPFMLILVMMASRSEANDVSSESEIPSDI